MEMGRFSKMPRHWLFFRESLYRYVRICIDWGENMKKALAILLGMGLGGFSAACSGDIPTYQQEDTDLRQDEDATTTRDTESTDKDIDDIADMDVGHGSESTCRLTRDSCGACGLGVIVSCDDATDASHKTCAIPEGLVGLECDAVLFVDGDNGEDTWAGSKEGPLKSLSEAISRATSATAAIVVSGDKNSPAQVGPIVLKNGVSMYAGYDSDFTYTPKSRVRIEAPAAEQDIIGVRAEGIIRPTWIVGFDITTAAAPVGSFSNYGVHVANSNALVLRDITVQVGKGGDGKDGENGAAGADGEDGEETHDFYIVGRGTAYGFGKGGVNSECLNAETKGGHGGIGYGLDSRPPGTDIIPAEKGQDSATAVGGKAGDISNPTGGDGENGESQPATEAGAGGASTGVIASAFWTPTGDGVSGSSGKDGTGGAGGGGAHDEEYKLNSPAGSGGGAGGCGGEGGEGGAGGGGSFGVFLVNADIEIVAAMITANVGGAGGNGGQGGAGGKGGEGGEVVGEPTPGKGGTGGDGGAGGHGGGGAGGVSYGVYCHESKPVLTEVTIQKGGSAPGGNGANAALNGEPGETAETFGCD